MPWRLLKRAFVVGVLLSCQPAVAQGVLPNAVVSTTGVFFSAGADYRSIKTPAYSLGAHGVDIATFGDAGPLNVFKPKVSGVAGQATLGLVTPAGSALAALGSNVRVAVTGGYFEADGVISGFGAHGFPAWVMLDGAVTFGCGCVSSQLTTRLSGWNVGVNAASDVRNGQFLWTPTVEVLIASTQNRQTLVQASPTDTYSANTRLKWNDAGLKVGLQMSVLASAPIELSLGGTLAMLYRRAELAGSDFLDVAGTDITSSIAPTADTWTLVPALSAQLTLRPASNLRIGITGAVEWDTRTPQIVSPTFADFLSFQGSPASIGFATQTSYSIGGSFTYVFNR